MLFVDLVMLLCERGVLLQDVGSRLASQFQQLTICCKGGDMQVERQSRLLRSLQIAGAAQLQISFGYAETFRLLRTRVEYLPCADESLLSVPV